MDKESILAIDPKRLATILADIVELHPSVARRLQFAAALQENADIVTPAYNWIDALHAQTAFLDTDGVAGLAIELDALRRGIVEDVSAASPTAAVDLLWHFFSLADSSFNRTDEEAWEISVVFDHACADVVRLAVLAGINPATFALKVKTALAANSYGECQNLMKAIASAREHHPTFTAALQAHLRDS